MYVKLCITQNTILTSQSDLLFVPIYEKKEENFKKYLTEPTDSSSLASGFNELNNQGWL